MNKQARNHREDGIESMSDRSRGGGVRIGRRGVQGMRGRGKGIGRGDGVRGMRGRGITSGVHAMSGIKSDDAARGMGRGSARDDIDER